MLVSMEKVVFYTTLAALDTCVANFAAEAPEIPQEESKAEALQQYREQMQEISNVINEYKALLVRDAGTIKKVYDNFVLLDNSLAGANSVVPGQNKMARR